MHTHTAELLRAPFRRHLLQSKSRLLQLRTGPGCGWKLYTSDKVSMPENETGQSEVKIQNEPQREGKSKSTSWWVDLLRVAALPLVTLILGFVFNRSLNERQASESAALRDRQAQEDNMRLYTEMMGRREQADSDLRKDMFKSILDTFMSKDPKLERSEQLSQEVLKLELLAYNFHESLDIGPLFKDVRSRIPDEKQGPSAEQRNRL